MYYVLYPTHSLTLSLSVPISLNFHTTSNPLIVTSSLLPCLSYLIFSTCELHPSSIFESVGLHICIPVSFIWRGGPLHHLESPVLRDIPIVCMVRFERWVRSTFFFWFLLIRDWLLFYFILFYYILLHSASVLYVNIICSLSRLVDGILVQLGLIFRVVCLVPIVFLYNV